MRFPVTMALASCFLALVCGSTSVWPNTAVSAQEIGVQSLMAQHIDELTMVSKTDGWAVCEPSATLLRVFVSRDGGRYWSNVTPSVLSNHKSRFMFFKGVYAKFVDRSNGYIAVTDKYVVNSAYHGYIEQAAVLTTHDGGVTWRTSVIGNVKQNEIPIGLNLEPPEAGWILTATDNNGGEGTPVVTRLYKTQNGGVSWKFVAVVH